MTSRRQAEPRIIEQDVRRTQDEMGETVQKLEQRLSPGAVAQSVIGGGESDPAKQLIEFTKRNPIPVALIAAGLIWVLASSSRRRSRQRSKTPARRRGTRAARQAKPRRRVERGARAAAR